MQRKICMCIISINAYMGIHDKSYTILTASAANRLAGVSIGSIFLL